MGNSTRLAVTVSHKLRGGGYFKLDLITKAAALNGRLHWVDSLMDKGLPNKLASHNTSEVLTIYLQDHAQMIVPANAGGAVDLTLFGIE